MTKNEHNLENIFRDAFSAHEMDVSPKVWSGVQVGLKSAGLASGAASASAGSTVLGKAAAIIGFAGLMTAATIAEVNYHSSENDATIVSTEVTKQPSLKVRTTKAPEMKDAKFETAPSETGQDASETYAISTVKTEAVKLEGGSTIEDQKQSPSVVESSVKDSKTTQTEGSASDQEEQATDAQRYSTVPEENKAEMPPQRAAEPAHTEVSITNDRTEPAKTTAYFTHEAKQFISPNGDGINDQLSIEGYGVKEFYLRVMTQGGQVVFESKDQEVTWAGTDRFGNALPAGVYYFEIIATGEDDLPYTESNARGSVTVVR
jgi:gliding motility-associated-like protein